LWKSQVSQADVQVKQQSFIVQENMKPSSNMASEKKQKHFLKYHCIFSRKYFTRNFHITPREQSSVASLTDGEALAGIKQFIHNHTVNHQQANSTPHRRLRYLHSWDNFLVSLG